ncbi:hypothetical protein [Xanthobacter aminoxidans]|uniref:Uncharacterized protein n=1 Tax=Xanthobacter aminoxidans TaxID=186280 RepID=A0ABW6ZNY9_9HYPH
MSKMSDLLAGYDDRSLARQGDPVRYRMRVSQFLALYDRLLAGEEFNGEFAGQWLDALSRLDGNLVHVETKSFAEAMLAVMRQELPCYGTVAAQFAQDLDRLFNREERTSENLGFLQIAAAFEIARIKTVKGWHARLGDAEWRFAREMFSFSVERLKAIWDEAHPKPQVVHQVYVAPQPMVQPVPMGVPSYKGW